MLFHQCTNCGKLSPNRIAGDDNEYQILCVLKESIDLNQNLANQLKKLGLILITSNNKEEALVSLFGTMQLSVPSSNTPHPGLQNDLQQPQFREFDKITPWTNFVSNIVNYSKRGGSEYQRYVSSEGKLFSLGTKGNIYPTGQQTKGC